VAVKLTDIAGKAGVSIATVSRVIRKGHVDSSPSCQKVLQIVKEMGYEPNRVRKPKGMGNILFAMRAMDEEGDCESLIYSFSSFYGLFLYSAEKEIRKLQGTLTVCHVEKEVQDIGSWIRQTIRDSNCRGVILLGGSFDRKSIELFRENVPVVVLNAVPGVTDVDSVSPDDEGGVRTVVRRLVELGHRRIAFWADRDKTGRVVDHSVTRLRGYESGLEEAGLTYSRIYAEEISDKPFMERMEGGFRAYLEDSERPTAIVCPGDSFAYRILRMALSHGIDVPGKLSIFGFDDSDFSAHSHPQMSSVNIHRMWMGQEAVRLINRRLTDSECPPCQVTVQAKVIERETSGSPSC
jgi:LacI family transcriptional regulator